MRQNRTITLAEARGAFPTLGESAACAQKLKAAVFDGIREADMVKIMEGLVAKAKDGDLAATKVLLDFVTKSAPTPQLSIGARINVAGRPPVNGHHQLTHANGDEPTADEVCHPSLRKSAIYCRGLVVDILRGDKLGKTPDGILRLLNQREGQPALSHELLLPTLDEMILQGELTSEDGRYKLSRKMREQNGDGARSGK